jgi:hypothetical protein
MVERPACEVLDEDFRLDLASVLFRFAEKQRQSFVQSATRGF